MSLIAIELGTAYISVLPDTSKIAPNVNKAFGGVEAEAGKAGQKAGNAFSSKMGKIIKGGGIMLAGAAVAGVGVAITKGFSRLNQIDQAEAKLKGLGHSAGNVETIMDSALKSVKGTAFGLGDAATVAASTVAAGIEPGKELERTLKLVGDAATIGGASMEDMGSIFNKVAASGKLQGDTIAQLTDRGIPILQLLSKELGVSTEEVSKMASEGKINFETFQNAMESGLGGAALESGNTFKGSLDNLMASVGRLGESLLKPFFGGGVGLLGDLTSLTDTLTTKVEPAVERFAGWLKDELVPALADAGKWIKDNRSWLEPLAVGIGAIVAAMVLWTAATTVATAVQGAFAAVLALNPFAVIALALVGLVAGLTYFFTRTETGKAIWESFTNAISVGWEWIKSAFATAWSFIQPILSGIWTAIQFIGAIFATILLGTALVAWNLFSAGLQLAWTTLIKPVWDGFAWVMTWLWNSVLSPIWEAMKVGFSALGTFFQFVWTAIIQPVWNALGFGIKFVWDTIIRPVFDMLRITLGVVGTVFQTIWNSVIKPAWDALGAGIRFVVDAVVRPAFDVLKSALSSVGDFFGTIVSGIRSVWSSLEGALKRPISFLINTIWNGALVPAWNTIAGFLPGLKPAAPLPGFATGGAVHGPGTGTSDSILARLSAGEHVLTASEVDALGGHQVIYAIRALIKRGTPFNWDQVQGLSQWPAASLRGLTRSGKGDLGMPAFRDGGEVRPAWMDQLANGHRAAKMRNGNPYTWAFEDCSGYMSMIADAIINGGNGVRKWATGSFPGGQPWVPGLGQGFSVGVHDNPGGAGGGHTAGTLSAVDNYGSVNVESGGGHGYVAYGGPAAGADHPQWDGKSPGRFHLAIGADGAFESGGGGGGPSQSEQIALLRKKVEEILDKALNPIKEGMGAAIGSPPPEWLGVPPIALDTTKTAALDTAFDFVEGLGDKLRSAYNLAKDVVSSITGLFRDEGGFIPTGQSVVTNETGKPEAVLNWDQLQQIVRLMESAGGLAALHRWGMGDTEAARRHGVDQSTIDSIGQMNLQLADHMAQVMQSAQSKFFTSTRDSVVDFFGFSGLDKGIQEVWSAFNPAKEATAGVSTGATSAGDPNLRYETTEVKLDTKMPGLESGGAPGSGPIKDQVKEAMASSGWNTGAQWNALDFIVGKESGWNPLAQNPTSTAFGLFQFLDSTWGAYGHKKTSNPKLQGEAGETYIKQRYGDPLGAERFWKSNRWYDNGGWMDTGLTLVRNNTGKPEPVLNPSQWADISRQSQAVADLVEGNGRRGGAPLVVIENLHAKDEDEAMRSAMREARRASRSNSMIGGW